MSGFLVLFGSMLLVAGAWMLSGPLGMIVTGGWLLWVGHRLERNAK